MQFIIMNYCHCHQSAIIVIRVPSSSSKMLSSSSECYRRYHQNAIIVIKKMLSSSSKCYHRHQKNAIIVIRNCYHRQQRWCRLLQELLSSSIEVMSLPSQEYQYRFHNSEITVFTIVISSLTKFIVWFA